MNSSPLRPTIDRVTSHMCAGLSADIEYMQSTARSYFRCANCETAIPVHYVNFSMLCAECRLECTEESDSEEDVCTYCGERLASDSIAMIGVYETPRSRKFLNLFMRRPTADIIDRPWELWFSENHLVGYFDWETVQKMIRTWEKAEKNIRVNNRITR
jgi:hypothetical protein